MHRCAPTLRPYDPHTCAHTYRQTDIHTYPHNPTSIHGVPSVDVSLRPPGAASYYCSATTATTRLLPAPAATATGHPQRPTARRHYGLLTWLGFCRAALRCLDNRSTATSSRTPFPQGGRSECHLVPGLPSQQRSLHDRSGAVQKTPGPTPFSRAAIVAIVLALGLQLTRSSSSTLIPNPF